jgi:hypothetical protein
MTLASKQLYDFDFMFASLPDFEPKLSLLSLKE